MDKELVMARMRTRGPINPSKVVWHDILFVIPILKWKTLGIQCMIWLVELILNPSQACSHTCPSIPSINRQESIHMWTDVHRSICIQHSKIHRNKLKIKSKIPLYNGFKRSMKLGFCFLFLLYIKLDVLILHI